MSRSAALAELRARILHATPTPTLFLGAGASIASGGRTAQSITDGLLLKIYTGVTTSASAAAEIFRQQHGRSATFENVLDKLGATTDQRRSLLSPFFSQMRPSPGYRALALAVHYGYFGRVILTTNFDSMIEESFAGLNSEFGFSDEVITVVEGDPIPVPAVTSSGDSGSVIVVKLHGSLDRPDVPLRVMYSETAELPDDLRGVVQRELEYNGLLVIGYRLKDIGLRTTLSLSGSSHGSLSIILPDQAAEDDPDTALLLRKYGAQAPIGETFDSFSTYLAEDLSEVAERANVGEELHDCWLSLYEAVSFGERRPTRLTALADRCRELAGHAKSTEVRAFQEAVSYNQHPRGESYRLGYIIDLLRKVNQIYKSYSRAAGRSVIATASIALVHQLRDYYLLVPADEEDRRKTIEEIIGICQEIAYDGALPRLTRSAALDLLGVAEKERAMVTSPLDEARRHFTVCRSACEDALAMLEKDASPEAELWRGICYRHLAISYEQDANASADGVYREQMYRLWMDYSDRAVEILTELGEDAVRGYALMNRASGYARLATFELPGKQKRSMMQSGERDLAEAITALSKVEDDRGLVWSYIHLSENLRIQRQQLHGTPNSAKDSAELSRRGEIAAAAALSHSRLISDSLAIALAKREMGVSWADNTSRADDAGTGLRLHRAEKLLWESAEDLERIGYFRGAGHAFAELSRLYHDDWEAAGEISALASGIRACGSAIASLGEAFADTERLVLVFREIRRELDRFLDI